MAFGTAVNTSLLTTYLIKKFIPALEAELQLAKFTTKAIIPPGSGKIGRFNVFSNPPGTTTAISEGGDFIHDPNTLNKITTLTTTGTDCTIAEYGEYIKVTELQELVQVSTARDELSSRMAYGGALCMDTLVRAHYFTTGYAGQAGSTIASTPWLTTTATKPVANIVASVMGVAKALRDVTGGVGAKGFSGISGHPDGAFAGIFSPRAELDMVTEGTTGRITWQNAVVNVPGTDGQGRWVKGYMGTCYGIACYRTQNYGQATITSLCDINAVLADGWAGAVGFSDMQPKIIINDINSPYKNSKSVAWHAYFGTALIDGNRAYKLYTLAA